MFHKAVQEQKKKKGSAGLFRVGSVYGRSPLNLVSTLPESLFIIYTNSKTVKNHDAVVSISSLTNAVMQKSLLLEVTPQSSPFSKNQILPTPTDQNDQFIESKKKKKEKKRDENIKSRVS